MKALFVSTLLVMQRCHTVLSLYLFPHSIHPQNDDFNPFLFLLQLWVLLSIDWWNRTWRENKEGNRHWNDWWQGKETRNSFFSFFQTHGASLMSFYSRGNERMIEGKEDHPIETSQLFFHRLVLFLSIFSRDVLCPQPNFLQCIWFVSFLLFLCVFPLWFLKSLLPTV